jgi:hypothetical protein
VPYEVRPRYTAGSPAQVDRETATRVAGQEAASYKEALRGDLSPELGDVARLMGLHWIVFSWEERGGRFYVLDEITGKQKVVDSLDQIPKTRASGVPAPELGPTPLSAMPPGADYLPAGIWQHYKGDFYLLLGLAQHSENGELLVVYVALDAKRPGPRLRARPLCMWQELVYTGQRDPADHSPVLRPRFLHIGHELPEFLLRKAGAR